MGIQRKVQRYEKYAQQEKEIEGLENNQRVPFQQRKDNVESSRKPEYSSLLCGDFVSEKLKKKSGQKISPQVGYAEEPRSFLEKKLRTQYGNENTLEGWELSDDSPCGLGGEDSPSSFEVKEEVKEEVSEQEESEYSEESEEDY